jgi:hypothetical protein
MTPPKAPYEASARSPFAGCAILIAAVAMMVFLIGFSIYALFKQSGEISKFTAEKPILIATSSLDGKEASLNDLAERLEKFRQELTTDAEVSLALSPDDLNLAIAAYPAFRELKGTLQVSQIDAEKLRLLIAFPLNGAPRLAKEGEPGWTASDIRYLNATLVAQPRLFKSEIVLQIDAIEVPGSSVPPQFIGQMSPYRITERYLTDPILGPAMAKLTRVSLAEGKLIFTRNPKEPPAGEITNAEVDSASRRLFTALGLAATLFLLFAGIVIFISLRKKSVAPPDSSSS